MPYKITKISHPWFQECPGLLFEKTFVGKAPLQEQSVAAAVSFNQTLKKILPSLGMILTTPGDTSKGFKRTSTERCLIQGSLTPHTKQTVETIFRTVTGCSEEQWWGGESERRREAAHKSMMRSKRSLGELDTFAYVTLENQHGGPVGVISKFNEQVQSSNSMNWTTLTSKEAELLFDALSKENLIDDAWTKMDFVQAIMQLNKCPLRDKKVFSPQGFAHPPSLGGSKEHKATDAGFGPASVAAHIAHVERAGVAGQRERQQPIVVTSDAAIVVKQSPMPQVAINAA